MLLHRIRRLLRGPQPATEPGSSPRRSALGERLTGLLAGLGDQRLARLERAPWRWLVLRALAVGLPRVFNPRRAAGLSARIEAAFPRPDGGEPDFFDILIAEARCTVRRHRSDDPDLRLRIGLADLLRLLGGVDSVTLQWTSGQLDVTGDPTLLLRLPSLFGGRRTD